MTYKFVAQKQGKSGKHLIVFQLFHKRKIWNYGTGITVLIDEWNNEEQRVRKSNKQSVVLNGTLSSYSKVFENVYAKFGGTFAKAKLVSIDAFKEAIDIELVAIGLRERSQNKKTKFFIDYCKDFLQIDAKGKTKTLTTIQQYKATFEVLKEYKPNALLTDINKSYFEGLQKFLYAKLYTLNSVVNIVKRTNAVLNWLVREGIHTDLSYKSFEISKEETTQIALTNDDMDKIKNVALVKEYHKFAREIFLFQCYTGIRYSDLQSLQKDHFIIKNKINYLSFHNIKTDKKIEIPLFESEAFQIAKKYNFDFKKTSYSLIRQNILIKEIAEIAGLNDLVEVINYPQGKKTVEFKPKFELIGTHSARRTFITLATKKGLTTSQIGQITGQRIETVAKYIKGNDESKENDMMKLFE